MKELYKLKHYFEKENNKYSNKVDSIIKISNLGFSTPNDAVMMYAEGENATSLIGNSEVTNGSDIEVRVGASTVYKATKIDILKSGSVLVSFPFGSPSGFKPVAEVVKNSENRQNVISFLSANRRKYTFGGYSTFLADLLGQASGGYSDELLSSPHVLRTLYIVPSNQRIIILDKFDAGGTKVSEVIDLVTDLASIALTLGAAALSGGGATVIQFAKALNNLANASSVINIINNVIAGNGSQAVVGIVSLMLGLKKYKDSYPILCIVHS